MPRWCATRTTRISKGPRASRPLMMRAGRPRSSQTKKAGAILFGTPPPGATRCAIQGGERQPRRCRRLEGARPAETLSAHEPPITVTRAEPASLAVSGAAVLPACASAVTANDVAVGDELAQCPIDSVARDTKIPGEHAARWQPGVRRQRSARYRCAQAIADTHVRRLILARLQASHVDGEYGTRMLDHRLA